MHLFSNILKPPLIKNLNKSKNLANYNPAHGVTVTDSGVKDLERQGLNDKGKTNARYFFHPVHIVRYSPTSTRCFFSSPSHTSATTRSSTSG